MQTSPLPVESNPAKTENEKLDEIILLLREIRDTVHPPLWRRSVRFGFTHIWQILAFILLLFLSFYVWKIMGIVNNIEESFHSGQQTIQDAKQSVLDEFKKLEFWKK